MGLPGKTGRFARRQPTAPLGSIPVPGETWRPVGRKALVGAAYLAPINLVRPLVPEELEVVPVLPGRTLATIFVADYGPGSTLRYHELGFQPALVRFRGVTAAWNRLLLVDSPESARGGQMLGFDKRLARFDWQERIGPGGRVSGECLVRLDDQEVIRVRYRQGRLPMPTIPVRAMTIRDDMVLCCSNRLRGRYRRSAVEIEPSREGPVGILGDFGRPIVTAVATGYRGVMVDDLRALGFLPHRNR